jgi:hypothetical protein
MKCEARRTAFRLCLCHIRNALSHLAGNASFKSRFERRSRTQVHRHPSRVRSFATFPSQPRYAGARASLRAVARECLDRARFRESVRGLPWSHGGGRWARASSPREPRERLRPAMVGYGKAIVSGPCVGFAYDAIAASDARFRYSSPRAVASARREPESREIENHQSAPEAFRARVSTYRRAHAEGDASLLLGLGGEFAVGR